MISMAGLPSAAVSLGPTLRPDILATHFGSTVMDCSGSDNPTYAHFAHWSKQPPVSVYFAPSIPSPLLASVRGGMAAWESEEHPAGTLAYQVFSSAADIKVSFAPYDGVGNVLAYFAPNWADPNHVHFVGGEMVFDSAEPWQPNLALDCTVGPGPNASKSVLDTSTHEFGHALVGLADLYSSGTAGLTMHGYYHGGQDTLGQGDRLGIANAVWHYHGPGGGWPPGCDPNCPTPPESEP